MVEISVHDLTHSLRHTYTLACRELGWGRYSFGGCHHKGGGGVEGGGGEADAVEPIGRKESLERGRNAGGEVDESRVCAFRVLEF